MIYRVVHAQIQNDGTVTEGKRKTLLVYQTPLHVGGLYFLRTGNSGKCKLYRILEEVTQTA